MKWFSVIRNDNTVDDPFVADAGDLGVEDWKLEQCESIAEWAGQAWVRAEKPHNDGDPDDSLQNLFGLPVFSSRLQYALTRAGVDTIQYLPVRVLRPDGEEIRGFAIANVLSCAPALDLERSVHRRFPEDYFLPERRGLVSSVTRATLKRKALAGLHIIRPSEYKVALFVSETFRATFEDSGFTGLSFNPVDVSDA